MSALLRRSTRLPILLACGILVGSGCTGGSDPGPKGDDNADTKPPKVEPVDTSQQEAVFEQFVTAKANGDWIGLAQALTPESRYLLLGVTTISAYKIAELDAARLSSLDEVLKQHNLSIEQVKTTLADVPNKAKVKEMQEQASSLGRLSTDPAQAFADVSNWITGVSYGPKELVPSFYEPTDPEDYELTDVLITGNSARGQVTVAGSEEDEKEEYRRSVVITLNPIEGVWLVDLVQSDLGR